MEPAFDCQQSGIGPALLYHVFCCRDKVVEHIKLVLLCAGKMPRFAILAAAAEISLSIDAAVFKPKEPLC